MRAFILTPLLAATTALAAPSLDIREDIKYVRVTVQQDKISSAKEISVKDGSTAETFGSACSTALTSGVFADFGIIADIGPNGNGTITVGPSTYTVHENPKYSGGISCHRMYNDHESVMVCDDVPLPLSVQLSPINESDRPSCFGQPIEMSLQRVAETIKVVDTFPMPLEEDNSTSTIPMNNLEERQTGACSMWSPATQRVGDGNPHQNYWRKQLSENMYCGSAPTCSVGALQSKSYTIGWTASANAAAWISGGFAVQKSWTTGLNYGCTGHAYDTVCLWYNTAHTAYTVQNGLYNQCTGFNPSNTGNFVMFSPNQNNKGGQFYCVIGTCRSQGQNYWDKSGPAGGP